jgi:hypothetical protein
MVIAYKKTKMNNGRNNRGQFVKGHGGFKPKGAVSHKQQQQDQLLDRILDYFEKNLMNDINTLSPNQRIRLWLNLVKILVPKMKRIPYVPEPKKKTKTKFVFKAVPSAQPAPIPIEESKEMVKSSSISPVVENPLPPRRSRFSSFSY